MKKQLVLINICLALASSTFASPLFSKFDQHKAPEDLQKALASHKGYANFSGRWTGVCDDELDEKQLTIEQSPDFSSITMDKVRIPIDAISSHSNNGNFEVEQNLIHLRWSSDGQQLLGSQLIYFKLGNLSQGGVEMVVGKFSWSIENAQLVYNYTSSIFKDGSLIGDSSSHCVYNKV
jgi:hypothetical protein